ncbi:hypothetical protein GCM10027418_15710 [Mariniluteicoccus endophyticus]
MARVRRILVLGVIVALLVTLPSVIDAGPAYGRSVVGVARRTDGAVVVVTAWCIGNREEDVRITSYKEAEVGEELYRTRGPSSDPLTVVTAGKPDRGFEVLVNRPMPDHPMIAYNAGARRDWLIKRTYPSAATVFVLGELPLTDAPVPEQVMVGHLKVVPVQQLIAAKCVDPG